jgi:hypothetical protein
MFQSFGNIFNRRPPQKGGHMIPEPAMRPSVRPTGPGGGNKQSYSKVFRYRLPPGVTKEPNTVEIVGSFTHWQRVELKRDGLIDAWHANIHHIEGNKTHHYMLLVDGEPTDDKSSDGLAPPHGAQEERYALTTARGPRVLMLFGQTK